MTLSIRNLDAVPAAHLPGRELSRMGHDNFAQVQPRLLDAMLASQHAFTEAAFITRSPRLSSLFVRRAERQAHIVRQLMHERSVAEAGGREVMAMPWDDARIVMHWDEPTWPGNSLTLLSECIRSLRTSDVELARALSPSLSLAQRVSIGRHLDRLRWAIEELLALPSVRSAIRIRRVHIG